MLPIQILQREQIPQRQTPRNNWSYQPQPVPTRPLPRNGFGLTQLLLTRTLGQCLQLVVQRLHVERRMQDRRQMHYSRHTEQLPVTPRKHTLAVNGVTRIRVAQESECGDGAEKLISNCPAERPLAAKEAGAVFVVWRASSRETNEESWYGHIGLCDCVSLGFSE